jgi:hypothetical protein
MYKVKFKHNWTFELHIKRKVICFAPYETKELTEKEVNSPDFQQQKKYFVIEKIENIEDKEVVKPTTLKTNYRRRGGLK